MRRPVLLLGFAAVFAAFPAWQKAVAACDGPETIFEDKFADDAGGWPLKETIEVKDGLFIFKLPPDDMQSNLNVTFTVKDADICSETVWPNDEQPMLGAGLLFWGEDNRTYFQFGILNNGKFWIARKQDGKWLGTIAANVDSSAIKKEPGAANIAARQDQRQQRDLLHQRYQGARAARPGAEDRLALRPVGRQFRQAERRQGGLQDREGHELAGAKQLRRVAREIGEDRVGAGALAGDQALQHDALPVEPAALRSGHQHRILA